MTIPTNCRYDGPALFHVGYIKTATTYLQKKIFADAELGLGLGGGEDHRAYLVEWFRTGDRYDFDAERLSMLMAEMEEPLRIMGLMPVWSEETMLGDPLCGDYCGAEVSDMVRVLPRPIKVLITIREQRAFCLSAYAEFLKYNRHSLTDFIGTGQEPRSYNPILQTHFLRYSNAVEKWQKIAGRENVLVLPIEMMTAEPGAYFVALMEFLGLPRLSGIPGSGINVSPGATAIAAARYLNSFFVKSPLGNPRSLLERAVGKSLRTIDRLSPGALDRAISNRWKMQIEARYDGVFAIDNARLQQLTNLDLGPYGYQLPNS